MKPNDKAYAAARKVAYNRINKCFVFDLIKEAVDAAFATQFPPSENYAELIETLRSSSPYTLSHVAADALEAVLAERDALKAENESMAQNLPLWAHKQMAANNAIIERLRAERDALLACLAPVDDEALVEIAAKRMCINDDDDEELIWSNATHTQKEYYLTQARAAIAAIRPHIEAAERERCAKIAEHLNGWGNDFGKGGHAMHIAAAIRSGK